MIKSILDLEACEQSNMPLKRKGGDERLFSCRKRIMIPPDILSSQGPGVTFNNIHSCFPSASPACSIQASCQLTKGLPFGMTLELSIASFPNSRQQPNTWLRRPPPTPSLVQSPRTGIDHPAPTAHLPSYR